MNNCLVTTLKESVTDDSLLKLGEFKFGFTASSNVLTLGLIAGTVTLTLVGDAYFTDSAGTANYGKTKTASTYNYIKNNGKYCDVIVGNKYGISIMNGSPNFAFDLSDLKYSPLGSFSVNGSKNVIGDTSDLKGIASLDTIGLNNTSVKGSIVDLVHSGTIMITITSADIGGDVSVFRKNTSVDTLYLNGSNVTGNLSSFAECTNLKTLDVSYTAITGDTSSLANLTNLTTFNYTNTAITGNWPLV